MVLIASAVAASCAAVVASDAVAVIDAAVVVVAAAENSIVDTVGGADCVGVDVVCTWCVELVDGCGTYEVLVVVE